MSEELRIDIQDGKAFLTLDRQDRRNALSQAMIEALLDFIVKSADDPAVRTVCITGAGDKAFCSGTDLAGSLTTRGPERLQGPGRYAELLKQLMLFGKPLVARVNGPCLAGGLGLMLACDIVLARDDIFFCTPEVNVGIFPMMVGALLYRNVGRKKAVEMVLTGRKIPAPEAERIGLITRATAPEELDHEIEKTLSLLLTKSPVGLRIGKQAFHKMSDMPFAEALDYLCGELGRISSTPDALEGMRAFLEKRKPAFKGS